jgi:hypothetical protein
MSDRACQACGGPLPEQHRGRPRRYCLTCIPPGSKAEQAAAWRALNPEAVNAYAAARHKRDPREQESHTAWLEQIRASEQRWRANAEELRRRRIEAARQKEGIR